MSFLSHNVLDTVAERDYLSLYQDNQLKYQDVVNTLDFKKEDIAKATGMSVSSVRYDRRMPRELQARIREWAVLLNLVAGHFKGDGQRTISWFTTLNPLFGDITPRDMIRFGKYKKLLKFVHNAIAENRR